MSKVHAALNEINITPAFSVAVGQPFNTIAYENYLAEGVLPLTLVVEEAHEDNDYNCPLYKPVLFVKLDEDRTITSIDLTL